MDVQSRYTQIRSWPTYQVYDEPTAGPFTLPPMFKESVTGQLRLWLVGFDGETGLVTVHGTEDTPQIPPPTDLVPKRGQTMLQQAVQEARQKWRLKHREGFLPAEGMEERHVQPMLLMPYLPKRVKTWPVYVQPKLDGVRVLAKMRAEGPYLYSRGNKEYTTLGEIREAVVGLFAYLPGGTILDGEVYYHGQGESRPLTRNEITSAVKRSKVRNPIVTLLQYHIFDIDTVDAMPYDERYSVLAAAYKRWKRDVEGPRLLYRVRARLATSDEDVTLWHREFTSQGYEGTIVRRLGQPLKDSCYHHGRCQNVMKLKDEEDEEGTILDIRECRGKNKGSAKFVVRDPRGNTFRLVMAATLEQKREWFSHPQSVIGKQVNYKFQCLSEYGVPQFPVGVSIRDYE